MTGGVKACTAQQPTITGGGSYVEVAYFTNSAERQMTLIGASGE